MSVFNDGSVLLPCMRTFLIENGVGRLPQQAGDDPPIWLDPRRGVPYPGQTEGLGAGETGQELVVALETATGIPSQPYESFIDTPHVTMVIRSKRSPQAKRLHHIVRGLLHDKRNYVLAGLPVNESMLFRELQPLGSDEFGYVFNCEYQFSIWSDDDL